MRQPFRNPHSAQPAFQFEEVSLPAGEIHRVQESTLLPPSVTPPEYIPVYTVFLRRSDVLPVRERPVIRSPVDVSHVMADYLRGTDREHFVILMLDTKNAVIGINTVSIGILDLALVHPREVYKPAILANAASIVLAHNHPSGDPTPSPEDRIITERLTEAGKILGIDVLDHVVIGAAGKFTSLKERGLIP